MADPRATQGSSGSALLGLAPEIFENIAHFVDRRDLVTLRLLNREANSKALKRYKETYYAERTYLIAYEAGVRALLHVAESNTSNSYVKKIVLCAARYEAPDDYPDSLYGSRKDQRISKERLFQLSGTALALLLLAFSRFRQVCASLEVEITDVVPDRVTSDEVLRPYGVPKYVDDWSEDPMNTVKPQRSINIVLEALALSGLQLAAFRTYTSSSCRLDIATLIQDSPSRRNTTNVWQHLRRLEIGTMNLGRFSTPGEAKALLTSLGASTQLEELKFKALWAGVWDGDEGSYDYEDREINTAILRTAFPALKRLSFANFTFDFVSFTDFLSKHSTLQDVSLFRIKFTGAADTGFSGHSRYSDDIDRLIETTIKTRTGIAVEACQCIGLVTDLSGDDKVNEG